MAFALSKESLNTEQAGAWFDRLQSLQITRRLGLMAMIAVAVAAGLFVFFWSQKPAYTPLYTGLDAKATAEATDMLRAAQIPFQLDQASGAISVPEENLHDARLKLAGAGLAESGRLGFEMMERDPGFGVSQFVENARYQHALEGVNNAQKTSGALAQAFELGDPRADLARVMVAAQQSQVAFRATVEVRNRLVQAYQDVMNMPL